MIVRAVNVSQQAVARIGNSQPILGIGIFPNCLSCCCSFAPDIRAAAEVAASRSAAVVANAAALRTYVEGYRPVWDFVLMCMCVLVGAVVDICVSVCEYVCGVCLCLCVCVFVGAGLCMFPSVPVSLWGVYISLC